MTTRQELFNNSMYRTMEMLAKAIEQTLDAIPPVEGADKPREQIRWIRSELQSAREFVPELGE